MHYYGTVVIYMNTMQDYFFRKKKTVIAEPVKSLPVKTTQEEI
jgi:hypothetical protein